jgi:quercetin dioxygenase-like cupin family protein
MRMFIPIVAALAAAASPTINVQTAERQVRLTPSEIVALPSSGGGPGSSGLASVKTTVLLGDPGKPGPYAIRLVVPPNIVIAPHTHRDDRTVTVVSGDWELGYGESASDQGYKRLPAGSFYTEPGADPHFARSGARAAVVIISGRGPTNTVYPDPASMPR